MKTYYAILRKQPAWVLVNAESLKDARVKVAKYYPGIDQLLVKRATPSDIDFVRWCDGTEKKERTDGGDTSERGLARDSASDKGTEEVSVLREHDHGTDCGCGTDEGPSLPVHR